MTSKERRTCPRCAARVPVRLGTGVDCIEGQLHDICRDAVLVETGRVWPIDTELQLSMQLPDAKEPIDVRGRIVRFDEGVDGAPSRMALLFTDVNPAAAVRIDLFLGCKA